VFRQNTSVIEPLDSLAVLPFSVLFLPFSIDIHTSSVLLSFVPSTNVFASIRPLKCALALLHVINVIADISTTVWPSECSVTLHLVVSPFTRKYSAISPFINSCAMDVIVVEVAGVGAVVSPCELALAVLFALKILAFVGCAIRPSLNTKAVLLIL